MQNKDYLMFDNLQDAIHWTETYKDRYKNLKKNNIMYKSGLNTFLTSFKRDDYGESTDMTIPLINNGTGAAEIVIEKIPTSRKFVPKTIVFPNINYFKPKTYIAPLEFDKYSMPFEQVPVIYDGIENPNKPQVYYTSIEKMQNGGTSPTTGPINFEETRRRQAWAESRFDDNAVSRAGAVGRFQIMPAVKRDYIKSGGRDGNLKDSAYNTEVRDWYMQNLLKREWVNKGNATDSVKMGKVLAAYNYGATNTVNALNKAKQDGINIYETFDWVSPEYLPQETVDYINWTLRNKTTGSHRNDEVYNRNKHKYQWNR